MRPSAELDQNLSDGVVAEKAFIEQLETQADHGEDTLDEDDAFLGSASPEVWEYDVVDARAAEFEEAIQNSDLVLEYDVIDTEVTTSDEATRANLSQTTVYPADRNDEILGQSEDASSLVLTGDQSESVESNADGDDSGGIDDLTIVKGNDPRLGVTNIGGTPAEDWAANTGPTRNPEEMETDDLAGRGSTLGSHRKTKR